MIHVTVRYFGLAEDLAGVPAEEISLPSPASLGGLRSAIVKRHPSLSKQGRALRYAVNRVYVAEDAALGDGDEVAVIPPVSGGSEDSGAVLVNEPIDMAAVIGAVADTGAGAVCSFHGSVRAEEGEVPLVALEYTAYEEMALKELVQIRNEAVKRFGLIDAAVAHRLGRMDVGEISVGIAVSARHRAEAFEACRFIIDTIKMGVPIWKKEIMSDGGTEWVGEESESRE